MSMKPAAIFNKLVKKWPPIGQYKIIGFVKQWLVWVLHNITHIFILLRLHRRIRNVATPDKPVFILSETTG